MIKVRKYEDLGRETNTWLDSHFHFNFANYYDEKYKGLGKLLVINDDIIKSNSGFDMHPHKNMEIITFVKQGIITHEDDQGNKGITKAGEVQVMSAGTGITHSEYNFNDDETILYQIWIKPNKLNVPPRWEQMSFQKYNDNELTVLVSGKEEHQNSNALFIHQDACIYGAKITNGSSIEHQVDDKGYILLISGEIMINNNHIMNKGDGAAIVDSEELHLQAKEDSELLIIEVH